MSPRKSKVDSAVKIALIGMAGTILAALITALFNPDLLSMFVRTPVPSTLISSTLTTSTSTLSIPTSLPTAPQTPLVDTTVSPSEFDNLIYEETFEDQIADEIEITSGRFDIVQTADGNHVWRTDYNGTSELTLPTESSDYAIQARIMQVAGTDAGQGTFWIRMEDGAPCKPSYLVYMVVSYDQVRLIEKDSSCEEKQETGLFEDYYGDLSKGVWYTVRIEVKGAEVKVYWDGELILEGEDTDGDIKQSNVIGFAACCNEPFTHTFDFDDIQVWVSNP